MTSLSSAIIVPSLLLLPLSAQFFHHMAGILGIKVVKVNVFKVFRYSFFGSITNFLNRLLRAALCNFHLGPCKIEKSKIAKLCHNKGLPKPFIKI